MKKYKVIMTADIYSDEKDTSELWNRFGNQFMDDFYVLLKKYTGNTYLFRNNKVEMRYDPNEVL